MLVRSLLLASTLALVACAGPGATARPTVAASGVAPAAGAPAKAPGPYVANGEADASSGKVAMAGLDTMKFSPNNLTKAKPGQTVAVELKNSGATIHSIVAPGLGLGTKVVVNPGQTGTATFTAPSAPGTYQFWCPEPGHAEAGMVGQVVVQ
jgi:uncharacterized cupredoxin-like copper-binding protein